MKSLIVLGVVSWCLLMSCSSETASKTPAKNSIVPKTVKQPMKEPKRSDVDKAPMESPSTKKVQFIPQVYVEPDPIDPGPKPDPEPLVWREPIDPPVAIEPYPKQDEVLSIAEVMPEFPGGGGAMREFISKNIHYPEIDKELGVEGKAYIKFIVQKDGTIRDVKCMKAPSPTIGKEAERIVKAMPKWNPAMNNNQKVDCYMHVPVVFKLN